MKHNAYVRRSKSQQKYVVHCRACGYTYKSTVKKQAERNCENHNAGVKRAGQVAPMPELGTKAYWVRYAVDNALLELGKGASRVVYALDEKRVLKLMRPDANPMHGDQCAREAAYWQRASEDERTYLAAVLESGNGWSIMERGGKTVAQMFNCEVSGMSPICMSFRSETSLRDLHEKNIAYFGKGTFKVIDYGI